MCKYNNINQFSESEDVCVDSLTGAEVSKSFEYVIICNLVKNLDVKCLKTTKRLSMYFNRFIKCIPDTLVSLEHLTIHDTSITEISSELINLKFLNCRRSPISNVPPELVSLEVLILTDTNVNKVPRELVALKHLECDEKISHVSQSLDFFCDSSARHSKSIKFIKKVNLVRSNKIIISKSNYTLGRFNYLGLYNSVETTIGSQYNRLIILFKVLKRHLDILREYKNIFITI